MLLPINIDYFFGRILSTQTEMHLHFNYTDHKNISNILKLTDTKPKYVLLLKLRLRFIAEI